MVVFVIQINELHDHNVLRELVLLLIPQLVLNDRQVLIQAVDRHLAQNVLSILFQNQMLHAESHEKLGITAVQAPQIDTRYEEMDLKLYLRNETMEIINLMMAAVARVQLKLDINVKVELITQQMCDTLIEEMGLSPVLKIEMIETHIVEMDDLQLVKLNLQSKFYNIKIFK